MALKGSLRRSRESFVVWALRREEASEQRARGFGEEGIGGCGGMGEWRACWKVSRRERRSWRVDWRLVSGPEELIGAIIGERVALVRL